MESGTILSLKPFRSDCGDKTIYCDVSRDVKIYVPISLRKRIFKVSHNLSHPSSRATKKIISKSFVWPSMRKDIISWTRTCLPCQRAKNHKHIIRNPEHISVPNVIFSHVHIDIVGPLPV